MIVQLNPFAALASTVTSLWLCVKCRLWVLCLLVIEWSDENITKYTIFMGPKSHILIVQLTTVNISFF